MNHSTCCEKCQCPPDCEQPGCHKKGECPCHQPTQECDCEVMAGMKAHTMECVFGKQLPQEEGWEKEFDSAFNWADQVKDAELERWRIMYGFTPSDIKAFIARKIKETRDTSYTQGFNDMMLVAERKIAEAREELNKTHVIIKNEAWEDTLIEKGQEGAKAERKRILALLDKLNKYGNSPNYGNEWCWTEREVREAITKDI